MNILETHGFISVYRTTNFSLFPAVNLQINIVTYMFDYSKKVTIISDWKGEGKRTLGFFRQAW